MLAIAASGFAAHSPSSSTITMHFLRFSDLCAAGKVRGQRVFIRADLNVPLDDEGKITEDTRIRASLPCIRMALDAGAAVMVTSHLGRPTEGQLKPEDSLAPVAARLAELLGRDVPLRANWVDGVSVQPGDVVLLENCRVNRGEKKNEETLARAMAALCDIFVNDAFGTAHRAEATTYGIAEYAPIACAPSCSLWRRTSINSSSAGASPTPSCWQRACPSAKAWLSRRSWSKRAPSWSP